MKRKKQPDRSRADFSAPSKQEITARENSSPSRRKADGTFSLPLRELLMMRISRIFDERGWTQKQAAEFLGVTQPRISDLSRIRLEQFTLDLLVDWLGALGQQVVIELAEPGRAAEGGLRQRLLTDEDAIAFYTKAITLDPTGACNYAKRGDAYFFQKKHDLAVGDYTRALEFLPRKAEWRLRRADAYLKLGQSRAALIDATSILKAEHDDEIRWWAYLCKARALQDLDQIEESLKAFNTAIDIEPSYAQAYLERGRLLNLTGRTDKAVIDFEKAAECDPRDGVIQENLASLRRQLHPQSISEEKEVERLTKKLEAAASPMQKAEYHRKRGAAYIHEEKQFAMALADFQKAMELDQNLDLRCDIAFCRFSLDDYNGAISECDCIIASTPPRAYLAGAYLYKGWAQEKLGDSAAALQSYDSGIACGGDTSSVVWARGILLERLGRFDEALQDYRQTVAMASKRPDSALFLESARRYLENLEEKLCS